MILLTFAATAHATVSMTVPAEIGCGTTSYVVISSDTRENYGGYIELSDTTAATFGDIHITAEAGPQAMVEHLAPEFPGWWYFQALSIDPEDRVVAGDHFAFEFMTIGAYPIVTIRLYDYDENVIGTTRLYSHCIPEPSMLAMLTLGSLVLRHRPRRT